MTLTPASDDEVDERGRLADAVVQAFRVAGLPAHVWTPSGRRVHGAEVEVDQFDDEAAGVFVNWVASQELSDRFAAPLLAHDFDHPAIRLNGSIGQAMAGAMKAILEASGFQVDTCDDDYRPLSLKVECGS